MKEIFWRVLREYERLYRVSPPTAHIVHRPRKPSSPFNYSDCNSAFSDSRRPQTVPFVTANIISHFVCGRIHWSLYRIWIVKMNMDNSTLCNYLWISWRCSIDSFFIYFNISFHSNLKIWYSFESPHPVSLIFYLAKFSFQRNSSSL